ncbi:MULTISPECIES: hypothetical protein [Alistipes]|uniref:Uncharacterized protein n=1 Tax=Alistipes hominis TaxID=2763015 RepID=A0ABR7CM49_9BACT|nr:MULTISPECIES: hypothetical protein [Alistipes]MBS5867902.1 hypothetical protein [Alistipes indistinctus]MDO5384697.1 hypothetical protein [Rikenellaceae bacterium]MBC5616742.1 hypothetical protein [Alistipes hominis]MBS1414360.1 hypothetical protein [Alistipes sp.]MQX27737.1 hypothetical protein [Alistipes sp. dk3620]
MKKLPICRFARLLAAGYQAQAGSGTKEATTKSKWKTATFRETNSIST